MIKAPELYTLRKAKQKPKPILGIRQHCHPTHSVLGRAPGMVQMFSVSWEDDPSPSGLPDFHLLLPGSLREYCSAGVSIVGVCSGSRPGEHAKITLPNLLMPGLYPTNFLFSLYGLRKKTLTKKLCLQTLPDWKFRALRRLECYRSRGHLILGDL